MIKSLTTSTNSVPSKEVIKNFLQSPTENSSPEISKLLASPHPSPIVIDAFIDRIYEINQLKPDSKRIAMEALRKYDNWSLVRDIERAIQSDKLQHMKDFSQRTDEKKKLVVHDWVQNLWKARNDLNVIFSSPNTNNKQNIAATNKKLQKNPAMPAAFAEALVGEISQINATADPTEREKKLLEFSEHAASLTNQHKGYMSVLVKDVSRKLTKDDNIKLLAELIPAIDNHFILELQKDINEINQDFHNKPQERQTKLNQVIETFISKRIKELPPTTLKEREFKIAYQKLAKEMMGINKISSESAREQEFEKLEQEAAKKFIPLPERKDFNEFIEKYHDIADIDTSKPRQLNDIQKQAQQNIQEQYKEYKDKIDTHRTTALYKEQLEERQNEVRKAIMAVAERQSIKADNFLSSINNIIQLMLAKIDATLHLKSVNDDKTKKWVHKVRDQRKRESKVIRS